MGLDFEGGPLLGDSCDSGVGLIDGEGDNALDDSSYVEIAAGLGREIDPTTCVLGNPCEIEVILGVLVGIDHIQKLNQSQ
jgi:hypothetical protein